MRVGEQSTDPIDQILGEIGGGRRELAQATQHEEGVQHEAVEPSLEIVGNAGILVEPGRARRFRHPGKQPLHRREPVLAPPEQAQDHRALAVRTGCLAKVMLGRYANPRPFDKTTIAPRLPDFPA